jgi:hypothetical protein
MLCFVISETVQAVHVAIRMNDEYAVLVGFDAMRSVR